MNNKILFMLEKRLHDYFFSNEERLLALQKDYQERGQNIDAITTTEYALQEDMKEFFREDKKNANQETINRVSGPVGILQYIAAMRKVREKYPDMPINDDFVIQEMFVMKETSSISEDSKPRQEEYLTFVKYVMEDFSHKTFKKLLKFKKDAA